MESMHMDDVLTFLEAFLDRGTSQVKWTTSIATFLITAVFTVVAFKGITFLKPIAFIIAGLLVLLMVSLLLSIIYGWRATIKIFILHRIILDTRSEVLSQEDDQLNRVPEKTNKDLKKTATSIEKFIKRHYSLFVIGIISSMLFFGIYIINMSVVNGC